MKVERIINPFFTVCEKFSKSFQKGFRKGYREEFLHLDFEFADQNYYLLEFL
jgi:hypothetical protein